MRQLKELITTDSRFQKSVNLQLDLGNPGRLESYIPTRSSTAILKRYLETISGKNRENATILIGPYGKGKSHLLLVLLAVLQGKQPEISGISQRIARVDPEAGALTEQVWKAGKPYLSVLVSPGRNDLNQSFLYALKEALDREGLSELAPASNYSEAARRMDTWKQEYPSVYEEFQSFLAKRQTTAEELKKGLEKLDRGALELFTECYPALTAGSQFQPLLLREAFQIYQEVNRELVERYGYGGIFLVFDEFSKYIEGHGQEGFAYDMKTLQDMCELANISEEYRLCMVLVAHKSVHEYKKSMDLSVKNAFRGVEGRLKEIPFIVSAQNSYELIADSIRKKEPEFSVYYEERSREAGFREQMERSFHLPCFRHLFSDCQEYEKMIGKGCFPLTPVCAYALLHISERVAQNERTVFTFLTSQEQGSLSRILERTEADSVGVDAVYDYFKGLFRESADQPRIHNEWLKAEYALKNAEALEEQRIIKAMAVIRMIRREDELPARRESISAALGMEPEVCGAAMSCLEERRIIIYRTSLGVYAFRNNVGVDIEREIEKEISRQPERFPVCDYLKEIAELEYVLPKQHNQMRRMTRYFQYEYITEEQLQGLEQTEYLFRERFADGKILALIREEKIRTERVQKKVSTLSDDRVVALVPDRPFRHTRNIRRLAAIRTLRDRQEFMEENRVLEQELNIYEEDIIFEVNCALETDFLPGAGGCTVCHTKISSEKFDSEVRFNRFLSGICEDYYRFSPKINHELLNIQQVAGQYLRARNHVVDALLTGTAEQYGTGTAPECMVYRAAFVRTGMTGECRPDAGCVRLCREIDRFLADSIGVRQKFSLLYQRLQGRDYGVRRGILPLFLAEKLAVAEGAPVIYLRRKELELSAEVLNRVNDFPEEYELYLEEKSAGKEQYMRELEQIFRVRQNAFSKQNRWEGVVYAMQKWYRSLPQFTMVTRELGRDGERIAALRNLLKRAELNPREVLFERLPELMGSSSLPAAAGQIREAKELLDQVFPKLQQTAVKAVKEIFGAEGQESLKACLISWHRQQGYAADVCILSGAADGLLKYLGDLETNDEGEIVSRLSRIFLDLYLEDWKDSTLQEFREEALRVRREAECAAGQEQEHPGQNTIILKDREGRNIRRNYSADIEDSTSSYLKNMIDEALEEFGDSLEPNQKVAVLVKVIEELI